MSGCVSSIRPPKAPPYVDFATLILSSDFLLCSRHHYYDHQGEPTLSWFTCWFTVIWKRSVPLLLFRLVVLRSDGSLADDAPPHVFKPSRSVMMSMLILDVWPPPSHMIGSTCCTPSTASCLTSRAPWLEWHPFLALQSRGDNLGDWKWQMSGQLYSQGGWCLQPASSPLCLSLLCQTVVSISVYSLWTSTEALVRLPRDWARPIFKHTNYFRYNNQMKQKLIAN